ncbi:hypothetical protein GCM10010441_29320 [Kitasatospora paracochleata]|uniref:Uncharacterized protein n=1 Tax=Kitasatospora paracochleata TaxID=58354 RepID=A0ABT1J934_9ACTN|nr:hypothetical protein [Kitasatospora paracochleata]MCP2313893.1 hypothetical protein [Kitasatospora paracochleata]
MNDPAATTPAEPTTENDRPDWTTLPAHAFTAAPRATQVSLFAIGDDSFGTPSLLDDAQPLF